MKRIAIDRVTVGPNRRALRGVAQLAASIEEVGLLNPITVRKNGTGYRLIAGYHRLEACKSIGWLEIEATVVDLPDIEAELAEIDENLIRNELTPLERAEQTAHRKTVYETLHPNAPTPVSGRPNRSELNSDLSFTEDTASKTGVTSRTVRDYVQIGRDIPEDVREALRDTPVAESKTDLLTIARQPVEVQREIAEKVAAGGTVKEAMTAKRRSARVERMAAPPLTTDTTYPVIYADPPWRYDFSVDSADQIEEHYPTMDVEEICALNVPASDNAVLFLWATAPKLREALQVMDAWGFTYKTHAIWDKERMGMGYWFRGQHELLLVGTRGDVPPPIPAARPVSVLRERCGEHSAKPETVRGWIEAMFPDSRYLEMFARRSAENWDAWGNEHANRS